MGGRLDHREAVPGGHHGRQRGLQLGRLGGGGAPGLPRLRPPTTTSMVPSMPVGRPHASSIARTRYAVVVLPSVPVMPTTPSCWLGSPSNQAAADGQRRPGRGTSSWGTPATGTARSRISAPAPLRRRWPRRRARRGAGPGWPRTATRARPARESWVTPVMSVLRRAHPGGMHRAQRARAFEARDELTQQPGRGSFPGQSAAGAAATGSADEDEASMLPRAAPRAAHAASGAARRRSGAGSGCWGLPSGEDIASWLVGAMGSGNGPRPRRRRASVTQARRACADAVTQEGQRHQVVGADVGHLSPAEAGLEVGDARRRHAPHVVQRVPGQLGAPDGLPLQQVVGARLGAASVMPLYGCVTRPPERSSIFTAARVPSGSRPSSRLAWPPGPNVSSTSR